MMIIVIKIQMLLRKQMKEMRDAKEVSLNLGMGAEVC